MTVTPWVARINTAAYPEESMETVTLVTDTASEARSSDVMEEPSLFERMAVMPLAERATTALLLLSVRSGKERTIV